MSLRQSAQQGTAQTDQNIIAGRAQMGAGLTVDVFEQNRIQAQGRIEQRFAQMQAEADAAGAKSHRK